MAELLSEGLVLPVIILIMLAFLVPRGMAKILPEGVRPLLLNAFLSACILSVLSSLLFVGLYLWQGADISQLARAGVSANIVQFGALGLASSMIWAPIMVLSVSGLPRKWISATW